MERALCFLACAMAFTSISVPAQVNSWINPGSGSWDQPTNWSLGILPNSAQAVIITNSGWKAVAINPSTPVDFPGSMTVSNLTIRGATNTENTLLLNFFGTAVPLTVSNGLTLQDGAQILNFNSGLIVQGGMITVSNSQINQDGGFIRTTNTTMYLQNSLYNLTNGVFEGGVVNIGTPRASRFNQYGGTVTIANVGFYCLSGTNENGYSLHGGTLNLPGGMLLLGQTGGASYFQAGGTNRTTGVTIEPDYGGAIPRFTLNGGLLADGNVDIVAGAPGSVSQNGGTHVITNGLYLEGEATHPDQGSVMPATYYLNGGTLSAGGIELNGNNGDSILSQSNGTLSAGTINVHSDGYYSLFVTHVTLAGGTLTCSNYITDDGNGTFNQTGGAIIVSNLLSFSGSRNVGLSILYGRYTFTGGTIAASNISIGGNWIIGDGSTNRISNPGFFTLSHTLVISNAVEQLGRFILADNATINLAGSASRLSFANSSGESWAGGATLVVLNWNGNSSGGGAEQLRFGTDQAGLTSGQLSQIRFEIGTNLYSAKILNTGELVPGQASGSSIAFSQQGSSLVLTWPSGSSLQSATNVDGPYVDVSAANSPYTNDMTLRPQRFFRLRQ